MDIFEKTESEVLQTPLYIIYTQYPYTPLKSHRINFCKVDYINIDLYTKMSV
jgi:hypothetical protein